jgi:hypothetical protein
MRTLRLIRICVVRQEINTGIKDKSKVNNIALYIREEREITRR